MKGISLYLLLFLCYCCAFASDDVINIASGTGAGMMSGDFLSGDVGTYDGENSGSFLHTGDIVITEIFPSSGGCIDEHIIIHSNIFFSGYLDIFGGGVSTGSISVLLQMNTGSNVLITDNIAGIQTDMNVVVVPSITLTNGGELIQLIYSGIVIDSVQYTDSKGPQSLFFSSLSGSLRIFSLRGEPSVKSLCQNEGFVVNNSGYDDGCSLDVSSISDSSGETILKVGLISGECDYYTGILWTVGSNNLEFGSCLMQIHVIDGLNEISFVGTNIHTLKLCRNVLFYYQKKTIEYYSNQSIQNSCVNNNKFLIKDNVTYLDSYCGIELQSPHLGFDVDSAINMRITLNGSGLNNNQKNFRCIIDFGNGQQLSECNPSSWHYQLPGVYTLQYKVISNTDNSTVCNQSTFLFVPPADISTVRSSKTPSESGELCEKIKIFSGATVDIVPNPIGSDSKLEYIFITGVWFSGDLFMKIGSKKINLGILSGINFEKKGGIGLKNDGMCFSLFFGGCGVSYTICYNRVKESENVRCLYNNTTDNFICNDILIDVAGENDALLSCKESVKKMKFKNEQTISELKAKHSYSLKELKNKHSLIINQLRTKERIARNLFYLYRNSLDYLSSNLLKQKSDYNIFIKDIMAICFNLAKRIQIGERKYNHIYTYQIKNYIQLKSKSDFLHYLFNGT